MLAYLKTPRWCRVVSHAVTVPSPPIRSRSGRLEVHQVPAWTDNFIYLLVDTRGGQAAVVDGPEAGPALELARELDVRIRTVINTHTHFDHIGINQDLVDRGEPPSRVVGPRKKASDVPGLTEAVEDGSKVEFAGVVGDVMLTEGHIDGHVSYLFEDLLFSGDTLFAGGCGYLFDGPPAKMHASLQRLAGLDPDVKVLCAHEYTQDNLRFAWSVEPSNAKLAERIRSVWRTREAGKSTVPSTLKDELETNPFVRSDSAEIRASVERAFGESCASQEDVFTATRRLKDRKDYKSIEDFALPIGA